MKRENIEKAFNLEKNIKLVKEEVGRIKKEIKDDDYKMSLTTKAYTFNDEEYDAPVIGKLSQEELFMIIEYREKLIGKLEEQLKEIL